MPTEAIDSEGAGFPADNLVSRTPGPCLLALALLLGIGPPGAYADPADGYHPRRVIVRFRPGIPESTRQVIHSNAGTVADQLQINTWSQTKSAEPAVLPYLWVACSGHSTVVRIATSTFDPLTKQSVFVGQILGRYYTAPMRARMSSTIFTHLLRNSAFLAISDSRDGWPPKS